MIQPGPGIAGSLVYRWRVLSPLQEVQIAEELARKESAVVLASRYGVSERTIHRIRHRQRRPLVWVEISHWQAPFEVSEDGPYQVGPWVPRE